MFNVGAIPSVGISKTTSPKVAAIVLNWNGWRDTVECVESLLRSSSSLYQIIIVDNASSDGSIERLIEWAEGLILSESHVPSGTEWAYRPVPKPIPYTHFRSRAEATASDIAPETPLVLIQAGENTGYAGGNNIGLQYVLQRTQCEYVWILNNDTVVDRQALGREISLAEADPQIGVIGAKVLQYDDPSLIQAMGGGNFVPSLGQDTQIGSGEKASSAPNHPLKLEHVIGASLFVRLKAVQQVGLMDETYFLYREETDWCIRMRQLNWTLFCCADAIVWHKQGRSIRYKSELHDYYSVRNMLVLLRKFHPSALPSALTMMLLRATIPKIARLQFRRLYFVFLGLADFFRGRLGRQHTDAEFLTNRKR